MIEMLTESSLTILVIGGLSIAIIIGGWLNTGRKELIYALLGACLLFGGLVLVERLVVTERERVKATLYGLAAAIERDDVDTVLAAFHPDAQRERQQLQLAMKHFRARRINIKSNLEIEVFGGDSPTQARAEFNAVAIGGDRDDVLPQKLPQFVIVDFYKDGDVWRVETYELKSPEVGFKRRDRRE